jgi:hypothetical protein
VQAAKNSSSSGDEAQARVVQVSDHQHVEDSNSRTSQSIEQIEQMMLLGKQGTPLCEAIENV